MKKYALDRVKKRLDRIRFEQAEIYSHFKKKYDRHQLDDLLTEQDIQDLYEHDSSVSSINESLVRANRASRKFSF